MPTTHGSFTDYTAKLVQPGAVEFDDDNVPVSVTDTWAVTVPRGVRPVLADISGLPSAGSRHGSFPNLVRAGLAIRNAVERAGSLVWLVDVSYAPQSESTSVSNPNPDPEEPGIESVVRILERAWPVYETQADLVADADTGDPVVNSAGEPYDRVPQITRRWMGARVKRAEQNWPELAASLDGTLNAQPVRILGVLFPSRTARLQITIEDTLAVGSESRYQVTYDVVPCHNVYQVGANGDPVDAGWDVPLLECGFSYLDSDGNLVRATRPADEGNSDPVPTPLPVRLDANGGMLDPGDDPVFNVVHTYLDADWTDLHLPATPTQYDAPEPAAEE